MLKGEEDKYHKMDVYAVLDLTKPPQRLTWYVFSFLDSYYSIKVKFSNHFVIQNSVVQNTFFGCFKFGED